jgi:oligoendopeptidase F
MEQEAQLTNRYYDLSSGAIDYTEQWFSTTGTQLEEVFVELIALRQQIARHAGYDDYAAFAYDCYHLRDYTPSQAAAYCQAIGEQLSPLYRQATQQRLWETVGTEFCTEKQALDYLSEASKAMGGQIWECYRTMVNCELYDISIRDNKYAGSYELYLYSYGVPFLFTNPYGMMEDKLSLTHEFGHFCNDYASYGSTAGTDVSEVFSQGLEYLSLCYVGTEDMAVMKMMDCLNLYVEQSAFASFEQQVYDLQGEELTLENVYALYEQVGTAYGFDSWGWDSRDFVLIPHFFTNPMYIISYVVSNDAALQLYQLEKQTKGAGLAKYEENLDTLEGDFLAFITSAELESPFVEGRVAAVRKTLEQVLK